MREAISGSPTALRRFSLSERSASSVSSPSISAAAAAPPRRRRHRRRTRYARPGRRPADRSPAPWTSGSPAPALPCAAGGHRLQRPGGLRSRRQRDTDGNERRRPAAGGRVAHRAFHLRWRSRGQMASINLTSSVHEHHNPGVVLPVNARTPGRSLQTVSQMRHAFAEPEGHGRTGHDGPRN